MIVVVVATLQAAAMLIVGVMEISRGYGVGLLGVLMFLAAPVLFLVTITFSRLVLETFVIIFRLREDTAALREMGERSPVRTERV